MLVACTVWRSEAASSARLSNARTGSALSMVDSLLNDELGMQRAGALDALQDGDDVARGHLDRAQRIHELFDGGAGGQAHRLGLVLGDVHLGLGPREAADAAGAAESGDVAGLREREALHDG